MKNRQRIYQYNTEREELEYIKPNNIYTLLHEVNKTNPYIKVDIVFNGALVCIGRSPNEILSAGRFDSITRFYGKEVDKIEFNNRGDRKYIYLK